MAAAAPAFTCHSRKQKEGRDGEGIWETKNGHKFLDSCPTEKWGFCLPPLNELLCPLQSGSSDIVPVSKPMSEETWKLTVSRNILWENELSGDGTDPPACHAGEALCRTVANSLWPSHHPHQHASRVASVDQPTHQLNVTHWPSGGKNKFRIHKIVRNNKNDCCFKPLSLWVICYAAIHNQNKIWYGEVGSCHHKNLTHVLGWVEALGKAGKALRRLLIKARRTSKRLDESLEDRQWGKCYLEAEFSNIITLSNMENRQDTQWTQESGWGYSRWKMEHTTVFFQLPMINYLKRLMD